jgi:hypothetical protein
MRGSQPAPGLHEQLDDRAPIAPLHAPPFCAADSCGGGGHPAGSLQLLSGDPDAQDKLKPRYPDFMSVANHLRFDPRRPLPNYVGEAA